MNHYKPFNATIIKLLPENDGDKKITALSQIKNHKVVEKKPSYSQMFTAYVNLWDKLQVEFFQILR